MARHRSDTDPDPYTLFPDTLRPGTWTQTAAHPGYERHVAGANLRPDPDARSQSTDLGPPKPVLVFRATL